ncbi:putative lipopolysaccharide heptosyltransferase III [Acidihalobacter yilgarnensis]|uniref:Putative lipopolysaccharide heptosyltransferase III n=1 Tax=Acidihalobacter yilgarnensis TaxID=2819280 RepID=A0A1D8IKR1_9GAMM|nr:putative lipopolysaccharide heptosyltransferase III [Acidihalobacter yilgarnensis]AOU97056.1 putative lipopolysaccharide heptosyltransferase III [Acidihalobacter yilgarnensis]
MNILVIKFRNIGDVLLTAPLVSALRAGGHRVSALVKAGTEPMLAGHPGLDELFVYPTRQLGESRSALLRHELAFFRTLRARRFDLAISTTEGDRGAIAARLSGAPRRRAPIDPAKDKHWRRWLINEPVAPRPGPRHTVLRNLDLGGAEAAINAISVSLTVNDADREAVRYLLAEGGHMPGRPLVHIHPTSRWFFKCWTDAGMAEIIDRLIGRLGVQVVLTCAPDARERARLDGILARSREHPIDLGGRLSLKQTAALSAQADVFFGVDTAPMHMAAAVGTPVVAIFGPSGAFDWGPWPNGHTAENPYPARSGLQQAGRHHVIQQAWGCVPCGQDGCDGSKRSDCLDRLPASLVMAELEAALDQASAA